MPGCDYLLHGKGLGGRDRAGVYRAPSAKAPATWPAEYEGDYFYVEFYQGWMVRVKGDGQSWNVAPSVAGQPNASYWATNLASNPVSFEMGGDGALYYASLGSGSIRRIIYTGKVATTTESMSSLKSKF